MCVYVCVCVKESSGAVLGNNIKKLTRTHWSVEEQAIKCKRGAVCMREC